MYQSDGTNALVANNDVRRPIDIFSSGISCCSVADVQSACE